MMKTVAVIFSFVAVVLLVAVMALRYYDNEFPYGRMWETPGVRPHEIPIYPMESGIVPFSGGEEIYRKLPAQKIESFLEEGEIDFVAGFKGYKYYCMPCHGENHDGMGTVGQSFAPLPTDLRSERVQKQISDGLFFKEISYGIPGKRQPPLATTIAIDTRWQIIAYVQSLGPRP